MAKYKVARGRPKTVSKGKKCKACGSENVQATGKSGTVQRFRCLNCRVNFTTGSYLLRRKAMKTAPAEQCPVCQSDSTVWHTKRRDPPIRHCKNCGAYYTVRVDSKKDVKEG